MKIALYLSPAGDSAAAERTERTVAEMLAAQRHEPGCAARLLPFPLGCLGLLGRPDETAAAWPVWTSADGSFLAFAGLPLARDGGLTIARTDGSPQQRAPLPPLAREALAGADPDRTRARLAALDGAFVALWWSAPRGELTLVTDFLGMQPLYRATVGRDVCFASEVKAIARTGDAATDAPLAPDAGAWGAMLTFGHGIGSRTLLQGSERVPAAHLAVFTRPAAARLAERTSSTWTWPASTGTGDTEALRDAIGEAVRSDVAAYASLYPDAALLLSGGFDSRLILCLCRDLGLRPRVLVQSHPDENGDADARFAVAFARRLGLRPRVLPARADFFGRDAYLRFLARNEVATPSLGLFIPNVAEAVRGERHGVWEGLLLDPALKFDYGAGGFDAYLDAKTGRRRRAVREAARLAFAPRWREQMDDEYDALLAAERSRYSDDADGVWRFSVLNRSRFRTGVNPYQVYDTVTPPLTPGMSRQFWEVVATADPSVRFGKRLYRAVFERLAPDGLRVPIASGASLVPGRGGAGLYHAQRARAAAQRVAQRPRVARLLRSAGLPTPFTWAPSRFLDVALHEAALDDPRLNADWIRRRRSMPNGSDGGPTDALALELLMYWQVWHHAMRGDLLARWGGDHA